MLSEHCGGDVGANAAWQASGSQMRGWFDKAGLEPTNIELVEAMVSMPPVFEYVPDHLRALQAPSLGNFFNLGSEARNTALRSIDNHLSEYRTDHGFEMPFRSYLAIADI